VVFSGRAGARSQELLAVTPPPPLAAQRCSRCFCW